MRTRHTLTAVTAAALLALTGCSSQSEPDAPADKPPASSSPTPTLSVSDCADAVYEVDSAARDAGTDPADRLMPDPCVGLTADQYMDAIMTATQRLNQEARDDLQDQIDEAAEDQ
ncbi:hypothetical protein [Streptomyces sp. CS014]|uniref:hypothetical protein n=1 Tax=Streptomyces sp. CS014 TaxID=2162707 RepID=UPI000D51BB09|nr:hypothetical protein [Streptomyces sp. CS014]PVD01333.1 hypothetical protein DBP12_07395 [Streptomyces sp. CS014]